MSNKKAKIQRLAKQILKSANEAALKKIEKLLESGAIDVEKWDANNAPMLLPKAMIAAILLSEAEQLDGKGTSFEKKQKKEIKNFRCFI